MKIVQKLVASLHDKTEYVIQALNHGIGLKQVHRVIKFNQNAWLKPCIDMNTDLRKKSNYSIIIKKNCFKLMNNALMHFLEKLWKIRANIEILNLLQQKEEGII